MTVTIISDILVLCGIIKGHEKIKKTNLVNGTC